MLPGLQIGEIKSKLYDFDGLRWIAITFVCLVPLYIVRSIFGFVAIA